MKTIAILFLSVITQCSLRADTIRFTGVVASIQTQGHLYDDVTTKIADPVIGQIDFSSDRSRVVESVLIGPVGNVYEFDFDPQYDSGTYLSWFGIGGAFGGTDGGMDINPSVSFHAWSYAGITGFESGIQVDGTITSWRETVPESGSSLVLLLIGLSVVACEVRRIGSARGS